MTAIIPPIDKEIVEQEIKAMGLPAVGPGLHPGVEPHRQQYRGGLRPDFYPHGNGRAGDGTA